MSNKKINWRKFLAGKGYYIALALCAVAIGVSSFVYYRNAKPKDPALNAGTDVEAVATQPTGTDSTTNPTTQTPPPTKTGLPLIGQTVSAYAMDCLSYNATTRDWRTHNGIDIAAETGTAVCAAADGVVYTTYTDEVMGTTVVIRHGGGYVTTYSSLDGKLEVAAGDTVTLGQTLGYVGSSAVLETAAGDHVHFGVTLNDTPVDPADFLELG
jgi:murein DD-endopeptidase MepM/ murein hydrolase activator NlpD